jgi:hypothetical protein
MDPGLTPPTVEFYYPTGLAISPGRNALYVANSDFDLQYNAGTVQVVDLPLIRSIVKQIRDGLNAGQRPDQICPSVTLPCDAPLLFDKCLIPGATLSTLTATWDTPGACTPIPYSSPFIRKFATIGAFASGAVQAMNPMGSGVRLFVPVRGDPSITWFDVIDDRSFGSAADCPAAEPCAGGACASCTTKDAACAYPTAGISSDLCQCAPGKDPGSLAWSCNPFPFELDCGQTGDLQQCADEHRMGVDPYDNFRDLSLPVEPVGLDASDDGTALVSAHQISTGPAVGLSINDWGPVRPSFQFTLTGSVASGPSEVAHIPTPLLVSLTQALPQGSTIPVISYQPGFLVTYNSAPEIDLFRYHDDDGSPPRPYLTRSGQTAITVNASGNDSRGIVVDPTDRKACEAQCGAPPLGATPSQGVLDCLRACVDIPLRLFAANRAPASLLIGRVDTTIDQSDVGGVTGSGASDVASIMLPIPLATGPSKVGLGNVIGQDGLLHPRVFVVMFDSRKIFDIDPATGDIETIIETGRGPHPIVFDTCVTGAAAGTMPGSGMACAPGDDEHSYLYVGHFTDSYIGVIDLDMRHTTFGTLFASFGTPIAPRESK